MKRHRVIRAILLAVFLTATASLGWQFYRARQDALERLRAYQEDGVIVCHMGWDVDEVSRLFIELCLLVALVGSRLRRGVISKLVYVSGVIGALAFYAHWWSFYPRWAAMAEYELMPLNHISYLYRATYWDICIAAAIFLLLLGELGCMARRQFRPATACT